MTTHYLYRCYDADGDLIYIGCAADVEKRIRSHRKGVARASRLLRLFMVRYEASGPYPSKEAGLYAEREAIRLEQPLFNTQERGVNMPGSRNEVARYLIERGARIPRVRGPSTTSSPRRTSNCCRCGWLRSVRRQRSEHGNEGRNGPCRPAGWRHVAELGCLVCR
jgi:predicted GIY-YIG superfamily endonuclease